MRGRDLSSMASGVLFGIGLAVSGMTDPEKVKGFLDLAGAWDPSLVVVMGSALLVATPGFYWVLKQSKPLWGTAFQLPRSTDLDRNLIVGSAIFGIGWALGGFCPGPAVTSLANGSVGAIMVLGAMMTGFVLHDQVYVPTRKAKAAPSYPAVSG